MIRRARDFLVVNTSSLEGWTIDRYIGPISVHVVAGTNIFSDLLAGWTDVFGGRSGTYANQLSRLYADAVELLRRRAEGLGANAIVGLSIDFDELSAQGKSMFMLNALGTAVVARRNPDAVPSRPGGSIEAEQMEALIRRNELMESAHQGSLLMSEDVWNFITEYSVAELAPFALGVFLNDLNATETPERKHAMDRARRYLAALDPEEAKTRLYRLLGYNSHSNSKSLRRAVVLLIRSLSLTDYAKISQAFESPRAEVRQDALALLAGHAAVYRSEDMSQLATLQRQISVAFPRRWTPGVRRGLLGKERQAWNCPCGGIVNEDEPRCGKCRKDPYGMFEGEYTVDAALASVSARLRVLEEVFAGVKPTIATEG